MFDIFLALILFAGGLALLLKCADKFVDLSEAMAVRLGVPPIAIGLTVVAFGTSFPEMVVSVRAALGGADGLSIGNIVGSNIANTLLILGVAALLVPIPVMRSSFWRDGTVWAISTVLFIAVAATGQITAVSGFLFLVFLAGYLVVLLRGETEELADVTADGPPLLQGGLVAVAMVAGIAAGSHFTVTGAVDLAQMLNLPEVVIGVTILAFGTSLPELATTLACVKSGKTDMLIGNIIGSNIFNVLAVIGVTSILTPLAVEASTIRWDLPILAAVTIIGMTFLRTGWKVTRREGVVCTLGYASYVGFAVFM